MKRVGLIIILLAGFFYFSARAQEENINLDKEEIADLIEKSKKNPLIIKRDELKKIEDFKYSKILKIDQLSGNPRTIKEFEKVSKEKQDLERVVNSIKSEQLRQQISDRVVKVRGEKRGLGFIVGKYDNQFLILTQANLVLDHYEYGVEKIDRFERWKGWPSGAHTQLSGFGVKIIHKDREKGLVLLSGESNWPIEETDLSTTINFQQLNLLKRGDFIYMTRPTFGLFGEEYKELNLNE